MIELGNKMHHAFIEKLAGKTYPVLYEEEKDDFYFGYTPNYLRIAVRCDKNLHNRLEYVTIEGEDEGQLTGRVGKENEHGLSVL